VTGRRYAGVAVPLVLVTASLAGAIEPAVPAGAPVAMQDPQPGIDGGSGAGEVTDRYGIPLRNYRIDGLRPRGLDIGQVFTKVPIAVTNFMYIFVKLGTEIIVKTLRWALDFRIAEWLLGPVAGLIEVYQGFVGDLGLVPLALMICVFWFGLAALRGQVGRGVGEITLSFVLVVTLGAVLAAPGTTLLGDGGILGRAKDLGATIAVLAVEDPGTAVAPSCRKVGIADTSQVDGCLPEDLGQQAPAPEDSRLLQWILQTWIVDTYVRQPHQHLVYGQRLDCPISVNVRAGFDPTGDEPCRPHPCLDRYNRILRTTAADAQAMINRNEANRGTDPNSYMYDMMHPTAGGYDLDDGCPDEDAAELAAYNDSGDWERVVVVWALLFSLLALGLFIASGVLAPLIVGQLMVAVLAVALVFVVPVALLGGGSRRILWKWVGLLLAGVFMVAVALIGLSLLLVTTDMLLRGDLSLFENLLVVGAISLAFLWIQRRLLRGGLAGGASVGGTLGRLAAGSRTPAAVTPVAGDAPDVSGFSRTATAGLTLGTSARTDAVTTRLGDRRAKADHDRQQDARDQWEARYPDRVTQRVHREHAAIDQWHRRRTGGQRKGHG
jgi:hypothetical protein